MAARRPSTFEQRNLLHRLGIELDAPWVWITTDGPVADEHARWRVDAGVGELHIPLTGPECGRWRGFGYIAVGVRLDRMHALIYAGEYGLIGGPRGALQQWADDLYVGVYYQRVTVAGSPLHAELTLVPRRDAAIRNAHLEHRGTARRAAWRAMDHLLVGPRPGAPRGERVAFRSEAEYREAIRELHRQAAKQGWDLSNEAVCTTAWIARQLELIAKQDFSERTMERRNQTWGISLPDIRRGEV